MIHTSFNLLANPNAVVEEYRREVLPALVEQDYVCVDSGLRQACIRLNCLATVATTDCCESHFDRNRPKPGFYVAMLVNEAGLSTVVALYCQFRSLLNEHDDPTVQRLVSQVLLVTRRRRWPRSKKDPVNIWTIRVEIPDEATKMQVLACFNEAVNNVVNNGT